MKRLSIYPGCKGFTLLELMVVVVLIGLSLSMIVTNIGDGGQQQRMEEEARRLTMVAKLARDEAVMLSREIAMSIDEGIYAFEVFDRNTGWQLLQDDRIFRQHQLADGLELLLEMDEFEFTPTRKKQADKDQEENKEEADEERDDHLPRVYFLSSGEVQPSFVLYIREQDNLDSQRYKVEIDPEGEISWSGPLDASEF